MVFDRINRINFEEIQRWADTNGKILTPRYYVIGNCCCILGALHLMGGGGPLEPEDQAYLNSVAEQGFKESYLLGVESGFLNDGGFTRNQRDKTHRQERFNIGFEDGLAARKALRYEDEEEEKDARS